MSERNISIFKSASKSSFDKIIYGYKYPVHLLWTGDINADQEPDFLIVLPSHHETIILEFVLSRKANNKVTWERVARFTEWS